MTDRFAGTNPSPVPAGGTLTIKFDNPSLAGTTVTVDLTNEEGTVDTVNITLNASGKGSATWTVPTTGWDLVLLSHSTSEDHTVVVSHSGPSGLSAPRKKKVAKKATKKKKK